MIRTDVALSSSRRSPDAVPLAPARWSIAAALGVGSIGLLSLGMQPLLLGALAKDHRITDAAVGFIATIEVVGIALGSLLGLRLLRWMSAQLLTTVASLGFAASGLILIIDYFGRAVLIDRAAAGLFEGMMVSVALVTIANARQPERLSALFLTGQTLLQLCGALLLSRLTFPSLEADRGYAVLVAGALLAACLGPRTPKTTAAALSATVRYPISRASWMALVGSGAYQGAIIAIWVHLGLWLANAGVTSVVTTRAVALALGCQVLGGGVAALWGGRLRNGATIVVASIIQISITALLITLPISSSLVYLWSAAFFGLALFTMPSFTGLLIRLDPQRRAATYTAAAQLAGAAIAPAIAALFVQPGSANGALYTGSAALGLAIIFVLIAIWLARSGSARSSATVDIERRGSQSLVRKDSELRVLPIIGIACTSRQKSAAKLPDDS